MNHSIFVSRFLFLALVFSVVGMMPRFVHADFAPTDLANLKMWLDPTVGLYSDVNLSSAVSTDGSSVRGWADQSGTGNNATGTAPAILKTGSNGINGNPALSFTSGNGRLSTRSFLTSAYNHALTIYAVTTLPANQSISAILGNGSDFYMYATSDTSMKYGVTSTNIGIMNVSTSNGQKVYVLSTTINGTSQLIRVNNVLQQKYTSGNSGVSGSLDIGGRLASSLTWSGLVGDVLVYNAAHTQAEMTQVTDYLMQKYGAPALTSLPVVAIEGNSWVAGVGATQGQTDIGSVVANSLGSTHSYTVAGVSGRRIDTLISQAPTEVDPAVSGSQPNIFTGWEIINQLSFGSTPAQTLTLLQQWFNERATAGWNRRIVVDSLPNSTEETDRATVNSALALLFPTATAYSNVYKAATSTTWADYLVRVSEDPNMGGSGQNTNATYYAGDQVHPNATGYSTLAPYIANAIRLASIMAPTVTTSAASAVGPTSATLNGSSIVDPTASTTVRGFAYGLTTAYGATTTDSGTYGSGAFTGNATSLTCNTTYHVRAYASNSEMTGYGSDVTFSTASCGSSSVVSVFGKVIRVVGAKLRIR